MNNFSNWTTILSTNTLGYSINYPNQYYQSPSMVSWYRLPRPMLKIEAEAILGVILNPGPATDYFLQGNWIEENKLEKLGFALYNHPRLVQAVFPQGYNPNYNYPSFELMVSLYSASVESAELSAETQVVKKTRALLKTKGQNDYTPDTAQMIDSFLSKIKEKERVRL